MTHRERAILALENKQPDFVPHFELSFQETEKHFGGRTFFGIQGEPDRQGLSFKQLNEHNAKLRVDIAKKFDHSIILSGFVPGWKGKSYCEQSKQQIIKLRELVGSDIMVLGGGDPTYAIPGKDLYEFSINLYEKPKKMKEDAQRRVDSILEDFAALKNAGAEGFVLWSDYAFNSGPFLSPDMFAEFITPYLKQTIEAIRSMGCYAIKHSDGNLMPVIDQILSCRPHALHSIDPMAGMDIKEIKDAYGDKICLCGNVHCAFMQTGTKEQITQSAMYALNHAKPNGGYIFCTSNVVFKGMPMESYELIHKLWLANRDY